MLNAKQACYHAYIRSDEWKVFATQLKEDRGGKCEMCGDAENLHVHHATYDHRYDEENHLSDLVVLCKSCHWFVHGFTINKRKRLMIKGRRFDIREISTRPRQLEETLETDFIFVPECERTNVEGRTSNIHS